MTENKFEFIIKRYGDYLSSGTKVQYSVGTIEEKTGRRLLNAYSLLDDYFLLLV